MTTLMPSGVRELDQLAHAVGDQLHLLLGRPRAVTVDPDGVAAEKLCRFGPLVVVFNSGLPLGRVRIAKIALAVAHDEDLRDAFILGPLAHLGQVGGVLRLVFEELVDVLDGVDFQALRDLCEVEVLHPAVEERTVDRPFRERDFVEGIGRGRGTRHAERCHARHRERVC